MPATASAVRVRVILPKGDFLPVPLIATLAVGAPLAFDSAESKNDFLARAQAALAALQHP